VFKKSFISVLRIGELITRIEKWLQSCPAYRGAFWWSNNTGQQISKKRKLYMWWTCY